MARVAQTRPGPTDRGRRSLFPTIRNHVPLEGLRELEVLTSLGVGVGASWDEEYGGSSLLGHDAVIGVPVVVRAAGGREDVAEQGPQALAVDFGMRVVGTENLGVSLDGCPSPAGARDDGGSRIGAKMVQLAGAADSHECDDLHTRQRMWHDPGVDHRRLDAAIAAQRAQHAQSVIKSYQVGERGHVSHDGKSFPVSPATLRTSGVTRGVRRSIRFYSIPNE